MEKRLLVHFLFLFSAFSLLLPLLAANASAINLCRWQGYANISNTSIDTNDRITVHNGTKVYNATLYSTGFYIADVQANTTDVTISFKICGVDAIQGGQAWSCPASDFNTLNLSIVALSNGASCTHSCACSGGYCCSGATEYTAGTGTGTCQASACAAAATTTTLGGGGGGGGGVTTTTTTLANVTTTTTTIPLPPKEETETIANIPANGTGGFEFTETAITDIDVTTKSNVSNPAITVVQSSSKPATVVISASNAVYGYLTITKTNIIDADVSNVKIRFKVAKSWISGNRIDESAVTLSRYSLGAWTALQTTKTGDDGTYVYFEAVSPGLSVFAISAVQRTLPTFWNIVTYIDNYYKGQITFWSLIGHISDYYTG
jgi:PGF-pre-PGF domain-containing protein